MGLLDSEWREGNKFYFLKDKKVSIFLLEKKNIPLKYHNKPPHEIVVSEMKKLNEKLDNIDEKLDLLLKK